MILKINISGMNNFEVNYDLYAQKSYSANVYKVDESEFIIEKRYRPT